MCFETRNRSKTSVQNKKSIKDINKLLYTREFNVTEKTKRNISVGKMWKRVVWCVCSQCRIQFYLQNKCALSVSVVFFFYDSLRSIVMESSFVKNAYSISEAGFILFYFHFLLLISARPVARRRLSTQRSHACLGLWKPTWSLMNRMQNSKMIRLFR